MACRCLTQLIEPLRARTAITALAMEAGVMTSRGLRSSQTIWTMRSPARRAWSNIFGLLAGTGAGAGGGVPPPPPGGRGADAGAADRNVCHRLQLLEADAAGGEVARLEEHVLDVDVLALVVAALLVAADDDDGGDVEAAGGHGLAPRRLVAGGEADHAVPQRPPHLHPEVPG